MKQKHIEASREVRLWLAQIVGPAVAVYLLAHPEAIERIRNAAIKAKIMKMFGFEFGHF